MTITFKELRAIKDSLPDGSMQRIAMRLALPIATVRNYFGGANFRDGESAGLHLQPGPDGGIVHLEDTHVLALAQEILAEQRGGQHAKSHRKK
jgi:hypothetical protein